MKRYVYLFVIIMLLGLASTAAAAFDITLFPGWGTVELGYAVSDQVNLVAGGDFYGENDSYYDESGTIFNVLVGANYLLATHGKVDTSLFGAFGFPLELGDAEAYCAWVLQGGADFIYHIDENYAIVGRVYAEFEKDNDDDDSFWGSSSEFGLRYSF